MSAIRSRRWLLGVGTLVLLATAGLNALGYGQVSARVAASGMETAWSAGLKALWLIFSLHLAVVASLILVGSVRPQLVSNFVLQACALIPTLDAVVLWELAGPVPSVFLAFAAILIWVATAIRDRAPASAASGPTTRCRHSRNGVA